MAVLDRRFIAVQFGKFPDVARCVAIVPTALTPMNATLLALVTPRPTLLQRGEIAHRQRQCCAPPARRPPCRARTRSAPSAPRQAEKATRRRWCRCAAPPRPTIRESLRRAVDLLLHVECPGRLAVGGLARLPVSTPPPAQNSFAPAAIPVCRRHPRPARSATAPPRCRRAAQRPLRQRSSVRLLHETLIFS